MLLLLLVLAGCHRDEITVYTVPKEKTGEVAAPGANQPALGYVLPDGWKEQSAEGMVLVRLSVPDAGEAKAEVSVLQFPAKGVTTLALINIVREKVGLPPMTESEMATVMEPVSVGSEKGAMIDLAQATAAATNNTTARVLLAVYPRADITWFFKLAGDSAAVTAQKPAFLQFLKSITFNDNAAPLVEAHKGMGTNAKNAPRASEGDSSPVWKIPAGWQEAAPSPMLRAKFVVVGKSGAKAEVNIGVAGGEPLMNINRWRGQLGLTPAAQGDLAKLVTALDVEGTQAMLVDMSGTDAKTGQKARMVAAIVPQGGQTWFYKLMGDEGVVEAEKTAFVQFVQTVKYPNAQ